MRDRTMVHVRGVHGLQPDSYRVRASEGEILFEGVNNYPSGDPKRAEISALRESEFQSFTHVQIYNGTSFSNDQILQEFRTNSVANKEGLIVTFIDKPAVEGADFTIEYGNYNCSDCE